MRFALIIAGLLTVIFGGSRALRSTSPGTPAERVLAYFKKGSLDFALSADSLYAGIAGLDSAEPASLARAKVSLVASRLQYKRISFFLDYFFPSQAWFFNAPSKYEVEEPFMEFERPHGLQQIEALLFSPHPVAAKDSLLAEAAVIRESAHTLPSLTYQLTTSDDRIMESLRLELIRVMALYITGYDAAYCKSGIMESEVSLGAIHQVLSAYNGQQKTEGGRLFIRLGRARRYLRSNPGFDSFDRLRFLADYALPLEQSLGSFINNQGLLLNSTALLDFSARNLFQGELKLAAKKNDRLVRLGRILFFDKGLSGNNSRSCASCHQPSKYYTDAVRVNATFDGREKLMRNTPTLLYAAIQPAQFWDGRAKTPADQIRDVLGNAREMHGDTSVIQKRLNHDVRYRLLFSKAFSGKSGDEITLDQMSEALVAFLGSLMPMNSSFDQYLRGDKRAMTADQKKGFNLFMGKAQCGACHFIPFFNGSTPPFYNRSEYEVLGVPANDNLLSPVADADAGRFAVFPSPYYRAAFKTPGLRNVAKTGPYMHHGRFRSLTRVVDFYNRGGGLGLGLPVQNQTLSPEPLHLRPDETRAIVAFLYTLTDQLPAGH